MKYLQRIKTYLRFASYLRNNFKPALKKLRDRIMDVLFVETEAQIAKSRAKRIIRDDREKISETMYIQKLNNKKEGN